MNKVMSDLQVLRVPLAQQVLLAQWVLLALKANRVFKVIQARRVPLVPRALLVAMAQTVR